MSFWCRIGLHAWQTNAYAIGYPFRSWAQQSCSECGAKRVKRL